MGVVACCVRGWCFGLVAVGGAGICRIRAERSCSITLVFERLFSRWSPRTALFVLALRVLWLGRFERRFGRNWLRKIRIERQTFSKADALSQPVHGDRGDAPP